MNVMATAICAAIALSAFMGVYLRLRQVTAVAAHRGAVPQDFVRDVSLDEHRRAADYTIARTRFAMAETLYDAVVSLLWLLFLLAPLYAVVARFTEPGLTRSVALVVCFMAATHLLESPFALANAFWLEERFGFNRLTLPMFLLDDAKSLALQFVIGAPALYALFLLLRAYPDTWWIFGYVGFITLMLLMTVIYPTLIAPLFNKFTPLGEGSLKSRMERLLAKCGFEAKGLYVMDASRRSAHGNAYFSGFGRAKRIVFYDTLIDKHSVDEIESILAHELGHFKFGHVRQTLLQAAVVAFVGFSLLHWAFSAGAFAGWFGLADDPGVVLLLLLVAKEPALHLLSPLLAWRSRRAEFEADDFAREMVGKEAMISALTRLTRDNLATLTPDRLYAAFYYSHPPVPVRIAHLRAAG